MNITVIGAGYVGLVTGACFAELGNHVTCVDVNVEKIASLKQGILPIYEPGLDTMAAANQEAGRLQFVTSLAKTSPTPDAIFIAVGTPSDQDGSADIQYVLAAARDIGEHLKDYCVIVDKSTVPVGMGDEVSRIISQALITRQLPITFDVVSNPEFLREGAAIQDFMQPDRIIIGVASERAKQVMLDLYLPILRNPERLYFMRVKDAEMTKYAANAMLATRISFMNEMAALCERMGVDVENVRIGIGADGRIGNAFLNAGCGYGGSCFPKDVRALMKMAETYHMDPLILRAVEERNRLQKHVLGEKLIKYLGKDLKNKTIALWGLAFKPGTDDLREASSLTLIEQLLAGGAKVRAYDPAAMPAAHKQLPQAWFHSGQLQLVDQQYAALEQADALALVTEWKPFCYPDLTMMKNLMRRRLIIDGRNQYDPKQIREAGFEYEGIGRY